MSLESSAKEVLDGVFVGSPRRERGVLGDSDCGSRVENRSPVCFNNEGTDASPRCRRRSHPHRHFC